MAYALNVTDRGEDAPFQEVRYQCALIDGAGDAVKSFGGPTPEMAERNAHCWVIQQEIHRRLTVSGELTTEQAKVELDRWRRQ